MSSQGRLLLEATFGLQALHMSPIGPVLEFNNPAHTQEFDQFITDLRTRQLSIPFIVWNIVWLSRKADPPISEKEVPQDNEITFGQYLNLVGQWRATFRRRLGLSSDQTANFLSFITFQKNDGRTLSPKDKKRPLYSIMPSPMPLYSKLLELWGYKQRGNNVNSLVRNNLNAFLELYSELNDKTEGFIDIDYKKEIVDKIPQKYDQLVPSYVANIQDRPVTDTPPRAEFPSQGGASRVLSITYNDTLKTEKDYQEFLKPYSDKPLNIKLKFKIFKEGQGPLPREKSDFRALIDELIRFKSNTSYTNDDRTFWFQNLKPKFIEIGFANRFTLTSVNDKISRSLSEQEKTKPDVMDTGPDSLSTEQKSSTSSETAMNTSEEPLLPPESKRTNASSEHLDEQRPSRDEPPTKRRQRYILSEELRKEDLITCLQKYIMDGSLSQKLLNNLVQHPNLDTEDINGVIETSLANLSVNIPDFVIGTTEEQIKDFFNILDRLERIEKFSMTPDDFEDKVQDYMKENIQKFNNNLGDYIVIIDKAQGVYKASIASIDGRSGGTEVYVYENKNIRLLRENATKKLVVWVAENRQERESTFEDVLPSYVIKDENGLGSFYINKFFNDERQSIQRVEKNDEQKKEMNAREFLEYISMDSVVDKNINNIETKHNFIRDTVLAFGDRRNLQIRFAASIKHFI